MLLQSCGKSSCQAFLVLVSQFLNDAWCFTVILTTKAWLRLWAVAWWKR